MKKPNNYDNTQAGGGFTPIELGGHTAVIKRVKETTSKSGKPMLQVAIDFDKRDSQPEYFSDSFQKDTREDKKWPYQGTQYIVTEDNDGNCSRSFKGFITSVESSNGEQCPWDDAFEKWFAKKRVGVVFGEVEEEYNGEIKTRRRIRYFCDYDKAKDAGIPEKKLLAVSQKTSALPDGFMNVSEEDEEEIPF